VRPAWQKAVEGLTQAKGAMEQESESGDFGPPSVQPKSNPDNLDRVVDPQTSGTALATLHQAAIDSEEQGRLFEQLLEQEIEPVIKDLSACLMYPDGARVDLGECISRFEAALENMRTIHHNLQGSVARVHEHGDRFQHE
jgi:hypothetical protein